MRKDRGKREEEGDEREGLREKPYVLTCCCQSFRSRVVDLPHSSLSFFVHST